MSLNTTHPVTPCRRCGCKSFIWIPTVLDRTGTENEEARPLSLTYDLRKPYWLLFSFGGGDTPIGTEHPVAQLQAYICRRCGLTEFFTKGFDQVPIGEEYGTYLVDVPSTPPYR